MIFIIFTSQKIMKLTIYILGTITLMVISLGIMFKLLNFDGANELIMLGMTPFTFLLIPLVAIYQYRKSKN